MNTRYKYVINLWSYSYITVTFILQVLWVSFSHGGFRDFLLNISWIREQETYLFKTPLLNSYSLNSSPFYQAHFVKL